MLEELKKLFKHSTIYGAGNVLGKLVGFFMIPFYTHYLTPGDYGTLELLDLSLTLTALVVTMWLNACVIRYYNDFDKPEDRNQAVSTIFLFSGFIGVIVAVLGIRFSRPLSSLILNTPDLHYYVSLEAVSFLVSTLNVICSSYLRAKQRSSLVVMTGLITLVVSLLLNIYFIAIRHTGVIGVLYSSLISITPITMGLCVYMIREVRLSFSLAKLKSMIPFGAPLVITSAAAFTVNFSDRFFLRHFATISTVGVYALGYKFGFMLSLLVVQPFDMIWQARIYEIAKQQDSGAMFARLFEYYCFVLVATALGLSIVIKELIKVIAGAGFQDAYRVVAIVALAYVFQGTSRFFLAGTYISKQTFRLGPVGLASAGANIALNVLLISRYGMLGAAWATALSFFLMSVLALAVSQHVYRIPYVFSRVSLMLGMAIVLYLACGLISVPSLILQISIKLALFVAFPIGLYCIGFFEKQEIAAGKALAQQVFYRYSPISATEPGR